MKGGTRLAAVALARLTNILTNSFSVLHENSQVLIDIEKERSFEGSVLFILKYTTYYRVYPTRLVTYTNTAI